MTRIFTDEIMFILAAATLIAMAGVTIMLIAWRDPDAFWSFTYCVFQSIITWFYFQPFIEDTPSLLPATLQGLVFRPALFGVWSLTVLYAIYRLRVKHGSRISSRKQ